MNLQTILDYLFAKDYHPNEVELLDGPQTDGQVSVRALYGPLNRHESDVADARPDATRQSLMAQIKRDMPAILSIDWQSVPPQANAYVLRLDQGTMRRELARFAFRERELELPDDLLDAVPVERGFLHRGQEVYLKQATTGIPARHPGRIAHVGDDGDYEVRFVFNESRADMQVITARFRHEHLMPGKHWRLR